MMTECVFVVYRLQKQLSKHNIVLASYDVVRNDIDFFSYVLFEYLCTITFSPCYNISTVTKRTFICCCVD